jgi:hypothetical protein
VRTNLASGAHDLKIVCPFLLQTMLMKYMFYPGKSFMLLMKKAERYSIYVMESFDKRLYT